MRRALRAFLVFTVVAACAPAVVGADGSGGEQTLTVWAQGPMTRVFPHDGAPDDPAESHSIKAARGEAEMVQVGIHTEGFRPVRLEASVSDLTGPGGAIIPASSVDVFYAEYVPVKTTTDDQLPGDVERIAPAFFPDPLVPEWQWSTYRTVPAATQSVWVRVNVGSDAAPGDYTATVTVSAGPKQGEMLSAKIALNLTVWDFELPAVSEFYMTNWPFFADLARWYRVEQYSEAHWKLIEMVADDMILHRQNVILTPVYDLVKIRRTQDGYGFEYADLDRWIEMFLAKGFTLIEGKHLWWRPRTIEILEADGSVTEELLNGLDDPDFLLFVERFFGSLWKHLGEKGWQDLYVQHVADEPKSEDLPKYEKLAGAVRAAAPGIRTIDALHRPGFARATDIPVPQTPMYDKTVEESGRPASEVWMYYCTSPAGPWPNRFIDYPPIRVRIFTWVCSKKQVPGFLQWGYNYWSSGYDDKLMINPWDDGTANNWQCGDPFVIYPPRDEAMTRDAIIGSIRWEMVREAVEDWEYLRMTRELAAGGNAEAAALIARIDSEIAPDWTTHTRDQVLLQEVRDQMGDLLSK